MKHDIIIAAFLLAPLAALHAVEPRDTIPDPWSATDALGRTLPMQEEAGAPAAQRSVATAPQFSKRCPTKPVPIP